jgi:hypothetical protein
LSLFPQPWTSAPSPTSCGLVIGKTCDAGVAKSRGPASRPLALPQRIKSLNIRALIAFRPCKRVSNYVVRIAHCKGNSVQSWRLGAVFDAADDEPKLAGRTPASATRNFPSKPVLKAATCAQGKADHMLVLRTYPMGCASARKSVIAHQPGHVPPTGTAPQRITWRRAAPVPVRRQSR